MNSKKTHRRIARPVLVAALAAGSATAGAQSTPPWYVGAQQTFTRDSNIFRTNTGEVSDTISSTALLAGVNLPFGRQTLSADALVRHDKFSDEGQLDNTGYRLGASLDWATIERLSGSVDLSARQELARNDLLATTTDNERTLQRVNNATFAARLGATSVLAIQGRLGHQNVDYDTDSALTNFDALDYRQNFASLGAVYRPSGLLTLGLAGRLTKGEYQNLGDDYDRKDIDLTATWVPTGISRVIARLSVTDEEHDLRPERDVSGVTGALQWDWRPTGKLRFLSDIARDTGSQIAFAQVVLPTGEILTATAPETRVVTAAGVRAFYELSSKIALDSELRFTRRSFEQGQIASDRTNLFSIGARWDPTRALSLGCSVARQSRSSSTAAREFDADIASCFARFTLQG
jgi:hypothetical protein